MSTDENDGQDLILDEGRIVIPIRSPYRRTRVGAGSAYRTKYTFDGLDDDPPDFMKFHDPLSDNDW